MAEMITVSAGLAAISNHVTPGHPARLPLRETLGLRLAESVTCRVDSPPHDKALMDGFAVRLNDVVKTPVTLRIIENVRAGEVPSMAVPAGCATRIMTGAPIPTDAELVVPVEMTDARPTGDEHQQSVTINRGEWRSEQNILRRGTIMRRDDVILGTGHQIRPIEMGLLAELGLAEVPVFPRPTVAILATGDELVPPGTPLAPGQIWNSNGPMLSALVRTAGGIPVCEEIVGDHQELLRDRIAVGLQHQVLILTGGVSMGSHDFVPQVLAQSGVRSVFHKVQLKPGKPIWFGVRTTVEHSTMVFGLPGNPVSTLVCFEIFVRPALRRLMGATDINPSNISARLTASFSHRGDRPTYFPAELQVDEQQLPLVRPLPWKGSADVRTYADANCLICFPAGDRTYQPDEQVLCQRIWQDQE